MIYIMTKNDLSDWFEKKYLEWQMQKGRASLTKFSKFLGISKGYLSQILNGETKTIGMKSALQISEKLNDSSLLDILGYSVPDFSPAGLETLPEELRNNLSRAIGEIREIFKTRAIDSSSPEGELLSAEILKKYGFIYNSNLKEND